ncbi:MAG TPA: DUF2306 domain-containing protein [Mucilaginibacter sp.]|jgi:hypothetical protein|nr:DUF2306 domain-containing protein [Mucilaginibacter sp.]
MESVNPGAATPKRKKRVLYAAIIFLSLVAVASVVRRIVNVVPVLISGYQHEITSSGVAAKFARVDDIFRRNPVLTLIHIIPAFIFIVLGPFQFSRGIHKRFPLWHRRSGRVFFVCGAIVGITALVMSFAMPAIGGLNQAAATTFFGVFFCLALFKAYRHILKREIELHREWMIRAYSIGLAVATIRVIVGVFFATSRLSGLTPYEFFGIAFWIGFTLHLVAAEVWINYTRIDYKLAK